MSKKVCVLLSTYNGERYLEEQLDSLLEQIQVDVQIFVRDDGSTDGTHEILSTYAQNGLLTWYEGKNVGPADSFMDLVRNAPECDYYAFCDQDDVWLPEKLWRAMDVLCKENNDQQPALYYGSPRLVNADLEPIRAPRMVKDVITDYSGAVIASNAGGCTMVFNQSLLKKVQSASPEFFYIHDEWFHKVCMVVGGALHYDCDVPILYRQHGNNVTGTETSLRKKLQKHIALLKTNDCIQSRIVKSLLVCYGNEMTAEQRRISEKIVHYQDNMMARISLAFDPRIRTKYFYRNVMFRLAVLMKSF